VEGKMRKLSSFTKNDNLTIKTNTIMTQVKLFYYYDSEVMEKEINQFLKENADSIKVIDIKYTSPSYGSSYYSAMIIYETL
jgi:hypothetical protein